MKTIIKMKQENNLSWKQKAARIAASVVLPFTGFLATKTAKADELNGLPADFNNDGIVDVRDMEAFGEAWLATEGQTTGIPVSRCGGLDQANTNYILMNDVIVTNYGPQRASCFTFSAGDINLDFKGHTILGSNPQSHYPEVLVSDNNRITIKNMNISHGSGIGLVETLNSTLEDINSNTNQYGVYTYDISNCKFENIETHSNSLDGIVISGEQNTDIVKCCGWIFFTQHRSRFAGCFSSFHQPSLRSQIRQSPGA